MIATPVAVNVPLRTDSHGTIRIGTTRVTLDSVIYSFRQGATPETIVEQFPALSLTDVYLVMGYYLQNRDEVDAYLRQQEELAGDIRRKIEQRFPPEGIGARLLIKRDN